MAEELALRELTGDAAAAPSASATVVKRPKEKRRAAKARARGRPRAVNTKEGSTETLLHAEPLEQASSLATAICRVSPSTPSKAKFRIPGMVGAPAPRG